MTGVSLLSCARRALGRLLRPTPPPPSLAVAHDPIAENIGLLAACGDKARAAGFDRLYLWLSFDCDTDGDAVAAEEIEPWLRSRGIRATYAVPGAQLERAADRYRRLAAAGATFMNHGHRPHAKWRGDRYYPITFYHRMGPDEVIADIRRGHETVTRIIGMSPRGFRAPHFGSFQAPEQLALIHSLAEELGYTYCSTTVPQYGLDQGPVVPCGRLHEIPLSGSARWPTLILDSWCHLEDRVTYRLSDTYYELLRETIDVLLPRGIPGLLSLYVDPAHVIGQAPFLKAMELLRARGIASVLPEDLLIGAASPRRPDLGPPVR